MENQDKPIANSLVVFREEFDDWAILFDPGSGLSFGLNPVSAFIWKCLDGKNNIGDIVSKLKENCEDAPEDADNRVEKFIHSLIENGLAGYEVK
jgi:SynChlorMet cassette protein ScmD